MNKTTNQLTVAIVGTGNVGRVLALALKAAGYRVTEIITRDEPASRKKGAKLARQVGARPAMLSSAKLDANVVWLCVSDSAISEVAARLAKLPTDWKRKTVLHSSGALLSAELVAVRDRGAAVASFHPMNTFLPTSKPDLTGTPFGAEGDAAAIRIAKKIATRLTGGAPVFTISPEDKVLYHAIGSFTSPLNISALNVAERAAKAIGIRDPRKLMRMILLRTVDNFLANGSEGAFSGPIRRGDVGTIRKHLAALERVPGAKDVYRSLALNALENLPGRNQAEIRSLLKDAKD